MKRILAAGAAVVLGVSGCGDGRSETPQAPASPPLAATSTPASVAPSVAPSPAVPEIWPSAVVAAMSPAMIKKYEARFATTEDDEEQYFYYADTLEELPLYVCIALAFNGDDEYSTNGQELTGAEASTVMSRASDYVSSAGSDVEVYANHEVTDSGDYVAHLAMDDFALVQLSLKHFCPEMSAAWKKVLPDVREAIAYEAGQNADRAEAEYNRTHPMRRFDDGRYTVGNKPGLILPGRYRLRGPLANCYWERSTANGSIIANQFITNAPGGVTVSVRSGEGFTSQGCTAEEGGKWERVG